MSSTPDAGGPQIEDLCSPIPFDCISAMSDASATDEQRTAIAQRVLSNDGTKGLVTLWAMQGYCGAQNCPPDGIPPSTRWWLSSENPAARVVEHALLNLLTEQHATDAISLATCMPVVDSEIVVGLFGRANERYMPGAYLGKSHFNALALRALAQTFFPQWPQLALPTCLLYCKQMPDIRASALGGIISYRDESRLRYKNPFHAFSEDIHALQYLACVLPDQEVGRMPTPLLEFRFNRNAQWKMYEQAGLSLQDSYFLACQEAPMEALPLPIEFFHEG